MGAKLRRILAALAVVDWKVMGQVWQAGQISFVKVVTNLEFNFIRKLFYLIDKWQLDSSTSVQKNKYKFIYFRIFLFKKILYFEVF